MALQVTLSASVSMTGVEEPTAYAKINPIVSVEGVHHVNVNWFADEQARRDMKQPVHQKNFDFAEADIKGDFYPALYAELKKLPEFAGAVDV